MRLPGKDWLNSKVWLFLKQNWFRIAALILLALAIHVACRIENDLDSLYSVTTSLNDISSTLLETKSELETMAVENGVIIPSSAPTPVDMKRYEKKQLDKFFQQLKEIHNQPNH